MHRFCTQCGTPVGEGTVQCPTCGHVLAAGGEPDRPPPPGGGANLPPPPAGFGPPTVERPGVAAPPPDLERTVVPGGPPAAPDNRILIGVVAVLALVVVGLGVAYLVTRGNDDTDALDTTPTTTVDTRPATSTEPSTTVESTSTSTSTSTTSTSAPTTTAAPATTAATATTLPVVEVPPGQSVGDVRDQPAGLFCRDLKAKGYSYAAAVDYWYLHGRPDRMDADLNGIPCETVYPRRDVSAYWGVNEVPEYDDVPAGLLCKDLKARGYTYAQAAAYWFATGSPDNMDADLNGIPCETVYPASDVDAYWN